MVRVVKEAAAAPRQRVREGPALAVAEGSHGQWLKGCTARWLPSSVTRPFPLLCSASPDSPCASGSPPTACDGCRGDPRCQCLGRRLELGPNAALAASVTATVYSALPKHQQGNACPHQGLHIHGCAPGTKEGKGTRP